jgi:hypothetical protein
MPPGEVTNTIGAKQGKATRPSRRSWRHHSGSPASAVDTFTVAGAPPSTVRQLTIALNEPEHELLNLHFQAAVGAQLSRVQLPRQAVAGTPLRPS